MIVSAIRRPSPSAILRSLVGLALLALACEPTPPAEPVALALPPKTTIADVHIRLGKVRLNQGLARKALEELDAALAESPDDVEALVLRARALALLSEVDPAIECAWQLIIDRLKTLGQLENLRTYVQPKDWRSSNAGGPRKLVREDHIL